MRRDPRRAPPLPRDSFRSSARVCWRPAPRRRRRVRRRRRWCSLSRRPFPNSISTERPRRVRNRYRLYACVERAVSGSRHRRRRRCDGVQKDARDGPGMAVPPMSDAACHRSSAYHLPDSKSHRIRRGRLARHNGRRSHWRATALSGNLALRSRASRPDASASRVPSAVPTNWPSIKTCGPWPRPSASPARCSVSRGATGSSSTATYPWESDRNISFTARLCGQNVLL